jgi:hypothetical protein
MSVTAFIVWFLLFFVKWIRDGELSRASCTRVPERLELAESALLTLLVMDVRSAGL